MNKCRIFLGGSCLWNNVIQHGYGTGTGAHGEYVNGTFKPSFGLGLELAGESRHGQLFGVGFCQIQVPTRLGRRRFIIQRHGHG